MDIKELDVVLLKDGRKGTVLELYEDGKAFMLEITDERGKTLGIPVVQSEEVEKIIYSA